MDTNPLSNLTWPAVAVALTGAVLWSLPITRHRWRQVRQAIGWILVILGAVAHAVVEGALEEFAAGAVACVSGLGASWLLVELYDGVRTVVRSKRPSVDRLGVLWPPLLAVGLALGTVACAPSLGQVQSTLAGYHVAAEVTGAGVVAASTRMVALTGAAGSRVVLTAQVAPDGTRGVVLERAMERDGVIAWRVIVRERDGEQWLRLERVTCSEARAELSELPACPPEAKAPAADVVERRIYLPRP